MTTENNPQPDIRPDATSGARPMGAPSAARDAPTRESVRERAGRFARSGLAAVAGLGAFALVGAAVLLAVGAGAGAAAWSYVSHDKEKDRMAPGIPVAIGSAPKDAIVTVRGAVAEVFGNRFVLDDGSGRMLVETGRRGEDRRLVKPRETVTVQGRFDDGYLRAAWLVRADGRTERIGGYGKKGRGPRDHGEGKGPKHERGEGKGPKHERGDGPRGQDRGPDERGRGERL